MEAKHEAVATVSKDLAERCQGAVGSDEHVTWAMQAYEGPNPMLRVLSFGAAIVSLALLLVIPPVVALALTVVVIAVVAFVGGRIWQSRFVALTDHGLVVLARSGKEPGAIVGRLDDRRPTQTKDVWRGYELDGRTIWVASTSLEAYEATTADVSPGRQAARPGPTA